MKNIKSNVGSFATAKLQAIIVKMLSVLTVVAVIGFSFVTCEDDDGSWNAGKGLKGTSWEQRDTYGTPGSSLYSYDKTYTITFTSDDSLTITSVGWSEIREQHVDRNYNITYTTKRTPVNNTYTGTYEYWTNTKEGYMNSNFWEINPWNFKILSDNKTMAGKLDTEQFTLK